MKRLIAIFLVFFVCSAIGYSDFSGAGSDSKIENDAPVRCVSSVKYIDAKDFFSDRKGLDASVEAVSLKFEVTDRLTLRTDGSELSFDGTVYAVLGDGYYDGKMLVGRITPSENYAVPLFRVIWNEETKQGDVFFLLENVSTGNVTAVKGELNRDAFQRLMADAYNNLRGLEALLSTERARDIVTKCLQPAGHFMSQENQQNNRNSSQVFTSTQSSTGVATTDALLGDLNSDLCSGSGTSNVPYLTHMMLSQTGWKYYKTSLFFYVLDGEAVTNTERNVCLTVCTISDYENELDGTYAGYFQVCYSLLLSYDTSTHVATLLYANGGFRLEEAECSYELIGGTGYFRKETRSHFLQGAGKMYKALIGFNNWVSLGEQIWSAMQPNSGDDTDVYDIGDEAAQMMLFDDKLVTCVGNRTKNGLFVKTYLQIPNTKLGVIGEYDPAKVYSGRRLVYKFKAISSIS